MKQILQSFRQLPITSANGQVRSARGPNDGIAEIPNGTTGGVLPTSTIFHAHFLTMDAEILFPWESLRNVN
jgi:hypothetical protein